MQAIVFPRSNATPGDTHGLLNITGDGALGRVKLPYTYDNGTQVFLGDIGPGYPSFLYPNFTYIDGPTNASRVEYDAIPPTNLSEYLIHKRRVLSYNSTLIQGPLYLNETSSLISVTVAINNNTSRSDVLGWLTVVMDAQMLYGIVASPEGLESTGEVLIVGPFINDNLFYQKVRGSSAKENSNVIVDFVLPPYSNTTFGDRHALRAFATGNPDLPFTMAQYPAVRDAWSNQNNRINNAGEMISTTNEEGIKVSVGYARLSTSLVDWVLVFEQSYGEVIGPINHFRNIVLACVFSVFVATILVSFPLAHCAARPIRALRAATQKSIESCDEAVESDSPDSSDQGPTSDEEAGLQIKVNSGGCELNPDMNSSYHTSVGGTVSGAGSSLTKIMARKVRFAQVNRLWTANKTGSADAKAGDIRRQGSRVPQRVPERRHLIHDELTDLTSTFNRMSDELSVQYSRLEERVKLRTAELEQSRNAAQDANESKTLFVANISHELRTPLNGILGMCAVAIQEKDMSSIRQSLKIIYKSGSLLSHLLNDLLTFSRNSFGQSLVIEDAGFRLADIGTQLISIFEKQAREAQIDLKVVYSGPENGIYGPGDTGLVKEMSLRGDQYRILQVLMNLVSNSLKFTPHKGSVEIRFKCIGYAGEEITKTVSGQRSWARATEGLPEEAVNQMFVPTLVRGKSRRTNTGATLDSTVASGDKQGVHFFNSHTTPGNAADLLFEFEVEDTGPGVPEHLQQEIFKPFVQGDLALSKKYGGTGLGLAICAQLAILMGGKITLKSTISVGSTFTLCIPLRYLKEQAMSVTPSLGGPGSTRDGSLVGRSLYDEPRISMTPRRDPSPAPTSGYQAGDRLLDVPRIVGFSQPYVTDYDASRGNHEPSMSMETGETVPPDRKEVKQPSSAKTPRVLVAEDNKVNQQVILRMLRLEKVQGK